MKRTLVILALLTACTDSRLSESRRDGSSEPQEHDEEDEAADAPQEVAGAFLTGIGILPEVPADFEQQGDTDVFGLGYFDRGTGAKVSVPVKRLRVTAIYKNQSQAKLTLVAAGVESPWLAYFELKKGEIGKIAEFVVKSDVEGIGSLNDSITSFDFVPSPNAVSADNKGYVAELDEPLVDEEHEATDDDDGDDGDDDGDGDDGKPGSGKGPGKKKDDEEDGDGDGDGGGFTSTNTGTEGITGSGTGTHTSTSSANGTHTSTTQGQ